MFQYRFSGEIIIVSKHIIALCTYVLTIFSFLQLTPLNGCADLKPVLELYRPNRGVVPCERVKQQHPHPCIEPDEEP